MKNKHLRIVIFILCLYLLGCIFSWDYNPGHWSNTGRVILGLLCIIRIIDEYDL